MPKKSFLRFFVLFSLLLPALILLGLFYIQNKTAQFYSRALSEARASELVSLEGIAYRVSYGVAYRNDAPISNRAAYRALRLAYEKTMARRNPLIAIVGPTSENLLLAIGELKKSEQEIETTQQNPDDAALIQGLYPDAFLSAAAELEKARLTFLESGTEHDASRYREALGRAIAAYQKDLKDFKHAFAKAVPSSIGILVNEREIVSREDVLTALDALGAGMIRTSTFARARLLCVRGLAVFCKDTDLSFASLPLPPDRTLSDTERALTKDVRLLYLSAGVPIAKDAPSIELSSSACSREDSPPVFVLHDTAQKGVSGTRPLFLGDIRFLQSDEHTNVPFFRYFAERGVRYIPSSPLSYYKCARIGSDWGMIYAVEATRKFSQDFPLSAYATGETGAELLRIEQALSSEIVREAEAIAYVRAAQRLTQEVDLPYETTGAIASLSLQIANKSAGFDQLLLKIAYSETRNEELAGAVALPIPYGPLYHFYPRAPFLALFLGNNSLEIGSERDFFAPYTQDANEPYIFYSSLPKTAAMWKKLVHDVRNYRRLHHLEL